jgi:hypothetical protein
MKLRLVAGKDVEPPAGDVDLAGRFEDWESFDWFEPLHELLELAKEAQAKYRRAADDVARRTGRTLRSVGTTLSAEVKRRKRRAYALEPFEAEEWCNLM